MSNLQFPAIRGLGWDIKKVPTFNTEVQQALSGREVRLQNFPNPIWEFTLHYEYLLNDAKTRDDNGNTALETLVGFFLARGGQFDDFLLNESDLTGRREDSDYQGQLCMNTVTGTYVGDGNTKTFQILRNIGGFLEYVQNPANQAASVYVGGALKVVSTDYAIGNGIINFVVAPGNGVAVTADYIFLQRVRFDVGSSRSSKEGIELNNFYYNLYECSEIQLISVRK
jgi:uncharacterized protein (TIGR02217 family)